MGGTRIWHSDECACEFWEYLSTWGTISPDYRPCHLHDPRASADGINRLLQVGMEQIQQMNENLARQIEIQNKVIDKIPYTIWENIMEEVQREGDGKDP